MIESAVATLAAVAKPLVRVLFCGDSITVGYNDIDFDPATLNGFRPGTANNLLAKGYQKTWGYVGNNVGGDQVANGIMTFNYQAGSGATIQNQTSNLTNFYPRLIPRVDCMRVLLGTNNVVVDPGATIANYTALLNAFFTAFPNGAASCAMIPPCRSDLGFAATIAGMNADITTVVATFLGAGKFVIQEAAAGLVDGDYAAGGVHMNPAGNVKEAVVAANGIESALLLSGVLP